MKQCRVLAGLKQTRKAVLSGGAQQVLLARDADPALTGPLEMLCAERGVPARWVESMRQLGALCALQVGAAAAAIPFDHDFSGQGPLR